MLDLFVQDNGLAVSLESLRRRVPIGGEPFRLARLLEDATALTEDTLRAAPALPSRRETIAVPLEQQQLGLALLNRRRRARDGFLRDLQASRVPFPAHLQVPERAVQLLLRSRRSAVRAADRRLQAIAQGGLVPCQLFQFVVSHGRGGPEEG